MDHLTRLEECLLDIEAGLGGSLQKYQSVFFRKALTFLRAYLASIVQVSFVPNQHYHYIWVAVLPHFFEPACQMIESLFSCYVVNQQGTGGPAIVAASD